MTSEQVAQELLGLRGTSASNELLRDLIDAAVRYARIRVDWSLKNREDRPDLEVARTSAHNVLIDACNAASRAMMRAGENNDWRASLGSDRRAIGDMACHLHCLLGLSAR